MTSPDPEPETKYTVTFDYDDGTTEALKKEVVKDSTVVQPADPTREGYAFKGWYIVNETEEKKFEFTTPITENLELKAKWAKVHTVTFDVDGGTTVSTQKVEDGNKATKPEDPTKTDYGFKYWTLDDSEFNFNTPITEDITLKAEWEINKYTVTFDLDGGTADPVIGQKTVEHGKTTNDPGTVPTKTGHTFNYWSLDGSKFNFDTPIKKNITLKAEWEINKYTVTFDLNGGTADPEIGPKTVEHGKTAEAPTTVPTKTGYGFDGWYADASATTAFDFENTAIEADITLSARWVKLFSVDAAGVLSLTQEGRDYIDKGPISIEIPATFDGKTVKTIKDKAFSDRKNITAITIPSSVTTIGVSAFLNTGITSIEIPVSVQTVGNFAFQSCSALGLVEIHSKNAVYGIQVFSSCSELFEVLFDSEMTSEISESMFQNCGSLESITIPKSVKMIGRAAFWGTGLTSVELAEDASRYEKSFPTGCTVIGGTLLD